MVATFSINVPVLRTDSELDKSLVTCTMAQSSASAAAEVLRAGDMDTSISKKKRKRSKKDRGLAGRRREIWMK